ncbi:MAG: hypothetical protein Q9199_005074 [Rusavskia elegans]
MAFSHTRPLSAFPARATSVQNQVTVDELKNILTTACDYALPSSRSKKYKRVKTEDELSFKNEAARLRDTFERGYRYDCTIEQIPARGSGGRGQSFVREAKLDFTAATKSTLDTASADVLYLLDCCHASTAAIKPGKELIAASGVETTTIGPRPPCSYTTAIVQELNQAVSAKIFLTAAQLYFKLLVHEPQFDVTPAHVEAMTGQHPRTSIFLAPLRNDFIVRYPLTGGNNLQPPGPNPSDIRATLFVRVRNGDHHHTLEHMKDWLPTNRRGDFEEIDVSFDYAAPSTSITIHICAHVYCCSGKRYNAFAQAKRLLRTTHHTPQH